MKIATSRGEHKTKFAFLFRSNTQTKISEICRHSVYVRGM